MAEVTAAATIQLYGGVDNGRQTTLVWLDRNWSGRGGAGDCAAWARVWAADQRRRAAGRVRATAAGAATGWPRRECTARRRAAEYTAAERPRRKRAVRCKAAA